MNKLGFFSLQNGEEDKARVLANVVSGISFRGSNLWILACAIVIASVGLNVNSTAVIIGAMLISPLMGPIVGAGFALGTYDFGLLKKSGMNLLVATTVSLVVATLYFIVSPFKDAQSELLARTSPNIYDVLIAFFGGLVGVIAITRVEKGNPIPGVAIATALMPPLCTAGYGLAIGNFSYFLGAFYLYLINCFFICISTFLIVKYLQYPPVTYVDKRFSKRIHFGVTALIIIMIVPSLYLAYSLFNEKKYTQKVDAFIQQEFKRKGYTVVWLETNYNKNPKTINMALLNKKFTEVEMEQLNGKLKNFGLLNTRLQVVQDNQQIDESIDANWQEHFTALKSKDNTIQQLESQLSAYQLSDTSMYRESRILFPEIDLLSIGRQERFVLADSLTDFTLVTYAILPEVKKPDTTKLRLWLMEKLNTKQLLLTEQ